MLRGTLYQRSIRLRGTWNPKAQQESLTRGSGGTNGHPSPRTRDSDRGGCAAIETGQETSLPVRQEPSLLSTCKSLNACARAAQWEVVLLSSTPPASAPLTLPIEYTDLLLTHCGSLLPSIRTATFPPFQVATLLSLILVPPLRSDMAASPS
jgi:hypothetical protein